MIELTNLTKVYGRGDQRTLALEGVTFRVDAGEIPIRQQIFAPPAPDEFAGHLAADPTVKNILLPLN